MEYLIATQGLAKFFGNVPALRSLNLHVPKGISGFIGPNGAGKTTTINILLGLLKPDEGRAYVFGLDSWHDSFKIRKRLGVLHEKPAYPGNFTGQRYLEHVAHIYGISQPKQRAEEVLDEVGLSEAKEKTIKTYSAGMVQRLGLAQALIGNPELVIVDEPTANLDPIGRVEFLEKIRKLHKDREVNFFISTHILPELEKVCEWVSIINDGVIVDQGNMDSLAAKYSASIYRIEVSDPDLFATRLRELKIVEKVWIEGNSVHCKVKSVKEFYGEVPRLAFELNLQLKSLQPLYCTLEEIFKTAVGGKQGEA
ncbi:MAG: ABC transporter ATP-binding protein [Candidatus Bathyarchaeota archaeon]|nr:ABC transporter ATP-binding protein [Candidatus Bathyarchaeota archaeon]